MLLVCPASRLTPPDLQFGPARTYVFYLSGRNTLTVENCLGGSGTQSMIYAFNAYSTTIAISNSIFTNSGRSAGTTSAVSVSNNEKAKPTITIVDEMADVMADEISDTCTKCDMVVPQKYLTGDPMPDEMWSCGLIMNNEVNQI